MLMRRLRFPNKGAESVPKETDAGHGAEDAGDDRELRLPVVAPCGGRTPNHPTLPISQRLLAGWSNCIANRWPECNMAHRHIQKHDSCKTRTECGPIATRTMKDHKKGPNLSNWEALLVWCVFIEIWRHPGEGLICPFVLSFRLFFSRFRQHTVHFDHVMPRWPGSNDHRFCDFFGIV